ncbi:MAG: hypothetical protein IJD82_08475 [Clostridia bacterium]|nr:hypothetical protein [Clostridia bacterium]
MKTFEQRKAEIFCRAQKQKEKEKKARMRAWGIGVATAFCLCVTVGVVLHTPNLSEDMVTDAESKGNAPTYDILDNEDNRNENLVSKGEAAEDRIPPTNADPDCKDEGMENDTFSEEAGDVEEGIDGSEGEMCPEDELAPEAPPEEVTPLPEAPSGDGGTLGQLMGADLALLQVLDAYRDEMYTSSGEMLLVSCDVLYMAADGEARDKVKLVLPLSYEEQIEKGDTLVALLADDDSFDTLLRDDTVCILGKSQEPFEELTKLTNFSAAMTADEALKFFESFEE